MLPSLGMTNFCLLEYGNVRMQSAEEIVQNRVCFDQSGYRI